MPSGSHAGGGHISGGGHSFGGSHSSSSRSYRSSSYRGGYRGGYHGGYRGWRPSRVHTVVFWGRDSYLTDSQSSKYGTFISLFVFALFACFISLLFFWGTGNSIKEKEYLYDYYQNIITDAEANDKFVIGKVTGYYEENGKYYLTYDFDDEDYHSTDTHSFLRYDGFTFSVYSFTEAYNYYSNVGEIKLAYDSPKGHIDSTTDTIPYDYKDTTLNDDGEYVSDLSAREVSGIVCVVIAGVAVLFLVCAVNVARHGSSEPIKEASSASTSSSTSSTTTTTKTEHTYCAYCGTRVDEDAKKCPSCGSRIK